LEARVVAAVTGARPPLPPSLQGVAAPEHLGWGEATLQSIREKLLACATARCASRNRAPPEPGPADQRGRRRRRVARSRSPL